MNNQPTKINVTYVPSEITLEDAYTSQLVANPAQGVWLRPVHILYVSEM